MDTLETKGKQKVSARNKVNKNLKEETNGNFRPEKKQILRLSD